MDMHTAEAAQVDPSAGLTGERFLTFHQRIAEAKRERREASAEASVAAKQAKAEGMDPCSYKVAEQLNESELTPEQCLDKLNLATHYLVFLGKLPPGTQLSMVQAPVMPKPVRDKQAAWAAGEAGLKAGREGEPADANPHKPGTEPHQSYAQQYKRGLEERATAARMQPD